MSDEPARMWIDLVPPEFPERGDVWIRLGEIRMWEGGWNPPLPPMPKRGRRRGPKRRLSDMDAATKESKPGEC